MNRQADIFIPAEPVIKGQEVLVYFIQIAREGILSKWPHCIAITNQADPQLRRWLGTGYFIDDRPDFLLGGLDHRPHGAGAIDAEDDIDMRLFGLRRRFCASDAADMPREKARPTQIRRARFMKTSRLKSAVLDAGRMGKVSDPCRNGMVTDLHWQNSRDRRHDRGSGNNAMTLLDSTLKLRTMDELLHMLGDIPASRVRLVWIVDLDARTVSVYTSPDQPVTLHQNDTLDGGEVLAGFSLKLADLFAELDRRGA